MAESESRPILVVGAGAAGLMAALWAARGSRPVLLLESTQKPGQKILISGGGRCNVLPSKAIPADFHTAGSPKLLRNILAGWPLDAVTRFFEGDLRIAMRVEEESGKVFPASNQAATVLARIMTAVNFNNVSVALGSRVISLRREGVDWVAGLDNGESIPAARVILATGGLSVPATGSDGTGYALAQALGHSLAPTYPALTPLTSDAESHHALSGVSQKVTIRAGVGERPEVTARGGFLFTHRGYSGPAVLDVSHVVARWECGERGEDLAGPRPSVSVQWCELDAAQWESALRSESGLPLPLLREHMPERLAAMLLVELGLSRTLLSQMRKEDRARLVEALVRYPLPWTGTEGYRVAEVTGGGVPLAEVEAATMESRFRSGLYLCGEMLDVFGPIGGYNFLWAWVTGKLAGQAAASS